jgi:hypothetical protein
MANQNQTPVLAIRSIPTQSILPDVLRTQVASGARLVRFECCISLLMFTIRRQSPVYLTTSWHERYLRGLGYSLLTLLLGPWAVPWGLIWTPRAIWVNLTGGVDQTDTLLAELDHHSDEPSPIGSMASQSGTTVGRPK